MDRQNRKAGIIVPVYNAFEELTGCVESIQKWTDLCRYPLILVNDGSTDERVGKYLEHIRSRDITVISNTSNKGFSASINTGIRQALEMDVILLNSDTRVTRGWAEKLTACAYQDPATATVTPLSNNATLCSVPDFGIENKIPDGYDLEAYAALAERVSLRLYPRIPVANGFCMYIRREVIEKIGDFDAETFGRGYGEENDFCFRASQAGYHHRMCDDTYIFHTGTKSFISEEKKRYIREHEKIIEERYPRHAEAVRIHCADHPNAAVSENIRFWALYEKRKRRRTILYLLQADFRMDADDHTGGTQLHVRDLKDGIRKKYDVLVAARNRNFLNLTLYTTDREFCFQYDTGIQEEDVCFRSQKFARLYGRILDVFAADCVHIHHTKGLSLEMYYEAEKRGIPVIVTLHDYYYVCPTIHLLDPDDRLCAGREQEGTCRECLYQRCGIGKTLPYLSIWREESRKALQSVRTVIVPSESARQMISGYFPEITGKIRVIAHGLNLPETQRRTPSGSTKKRRFHAAFLGGINTAKGYRMIKRLIRKRTGSIEWYLFGSFQTPEPWLEKSCHFKNAGAYIREELPELLIKYAIDLVCILPVCPETYSYTLSEALACGIPVLVTDTGALGERVRQMECGWIVPAEASAEDILDKIAQIRRDPAGYQKMAAHIRSLQLPSAETMCRVYRKLYEGCLQMQDCGMDMDDGQNQYQNPYPDEEREWLLQGILNAQGKYLIRREADREMENRLTVLQERYAQLESSYALRIGRKLTSLPVPFKKQLKTALLHRYRFVWKGRR